MKPIIALIMLIYGFFFIAIGEINFDEIKGIKEEKEEIQPLTVFGVMIDTFITGGLIVFFTSLIKDWDKIKSKPLSRLGLIGYTLVFGTIFLIVMI